MKTQAEKNKERLKEQRQVQLNKKEAQLNKMTDEEVLQDLKGKQLPTYGTKAERLDRLKKHYGIAQGGKESPNSTEQEQFYPEQKPQTAQQPQAPKKQEVIQQQQQNDKQQQDKKAMPKDKVVDKIEQMQRDREERRLKMEELKKEKEEKAAMNLAMGKNGDIDFELMILKQRFKDHILQQHTPSSNLKLSVIVRKRPIFKKEEQNGEIDSVSCANPSVRIHSPKYKVDGITKYVENFDFTFDNSFNENETTKDIYQYSLQPVVDLLLNGGVITCFAYGQTGSGKTFTMKGIEEDVVNDIYKIVDSDKYSQKGFQVFVTFFEIYGGRCLDLLNNKQQLVILEDKNNNVQIQGLCERPASTPSDMFKLIEYGHSVRTTHSTSSNDTSSRSHAICTIILKDQNQNQIGKLALVDLAGSERAQDCQSNIRQRRIEGAEINKSLLALKECIRAMDMSAGHVPFRASKLTLVLRDSFIMKSNKSRIIMIACISPGSTSSDHSLNTLRYADRLKENKPVIVKQQQAADSQQDEIRPPIKPEVDEYQKNQQQQDEQPRQRPPLPDKIQNVRQLSGPNIEEEDEKTNLVNPTQKSPNNEQQQINNNPIKKGSFHKNPSPRHQDQQPIQGRQQANHSSKGSRDQKENIPSQKQQLPPQPEKGDKNQNQKKQNPTTQSTTDQSQQEIDKDNKEGGSSEDEPLQEAQSPQSTQIVFDLSNLYKVKGVKDDVRCMKETLKMEKMSNEFFDFHEKVNTILEEQEEIFTTHMAAIKEDAKLLTQESELISNVQGVGFMDYDIDLYVKKLESVIKKKLKMYNLLSKKLDTFKTHLKEEEEIHSKVKENTFFYEQ